MLTRASSRHAGAITSRMQVRSFFDYLKEANQKSSGAVSGSQEEKLDSSFNWDFVDYFRKQEPEKAVEFESQQKAAKAAESWLHRPKINPPKLDFDQWRSKIADPSFVDKLEQEHKAVADYWTRFTKYEQTNEWSPAGWTEENTREYSFSKVDPTEKDTRAAKEVNAAEVMEKHRELLEEIKLDYEQLEAERDMFATSEEMVQHALHPQLAELQEETAAGKQTFTDFLMRGNRYARYVKKERLAQAQNENRRKIFLERWKHYSYLRGYEPNY